MNRKSWITAVLVGAALLVAGCASPTTETPSSIVTGVTITGTGVTGSGGSKEITVTIGTPVDLGVTVTKAGTPSVVETWTSANTTNVTVVSETGVVSGLVEDSTGVVVTVKVGTKSDTVLVRVVKPTPGLKLEFDTDKLEFQSIATNMEKLAGYATPVTTATPATVVKTGNVITAKNTDGTFKSSETFQGSSYLLYKTPLTGNFEVRAAVKITSATAASDKYSAQVGAFTTNAEGLVALDLKAATVAKRKASVPNIRPLYTKSSESAVAAGTQTVTLDDTTLAQYHVLATKRVGSVITYEINGATSTVNIDADADANGTPDTTTGAWPTLAGAVKAGIGFSGVTVEIEGFSVTSLKADGTVDQVLYSSGSLPVVPYDVVSVTLAGPTGYETSAAIDLAGKSLPFTHQLTGAYVPATATVGNSLTYSVPSGSNVTVDSNTGLVTINATGTATVTATSGNGKTATYTFTLTDSSQVLKTVTIPSTLEISVGQSKTLSPITYDPATLSAANKVLTWSSNSASILVDATTGALTVATGTVVGTTAKIKATSTNAVASNECTVTVVAPAATTLFSWAKADVTGIDLSTAVQVFGTIKLAKGGGTVLSSSTGLTLNNARFNIGSAQVDKATSIVGATQVATTATANVSDGQLDFSSKKAKVTITYDALSTTAAAGTAPVFQVYLNNNTAGDTTSPLTTTGVSSKLVASPALVTAPSSEQTAIYSIDPAVFTKNPSTLTAAFLQIRADSATTINITSIKVEYLP